jgi:hypothetical protein
MALSTSVTVPSPCLRRSTPRRAKGGQDGAARHPSAECVAFLPDNRDQPAQRQRDSHAGRYPLSAQDPAGRCGPHPVPEGAAARHSDGLLLAQPGRAVVRQDRTRWHHPWRLSLGARSQPHAHTREPALQYPAHTRDVDVLRCGTPNYSRINCYSPLVRDPQPAAFHNRLAQKALWLYILF